MTVLLSRTATEAAFGRTAEARMVDAIRASEGFVPALSLVADECGLTLARGCWSSGRSACVLSARGKESAAIWFALRLGLLTS